jgi:hypothetical protein
MSDHIKALVDEWGPLRPHSESVFSKSRKPVDRRQNTAQGAHLNLAQGAHLNLAWFSTSRRGRPLNAWSAADAAAPLDEGKQQTAVQEQKESKSGNLVGTR